MSDQDRGAYTPPTDAPLSFDARQPVRGSRPVPITLIISALVLILLVVVIVVFYRSGVRQAGEAPRAVGEPLGSLKSAAPADAQPADPAAGLQIYKSESGEAAQTAPTFAPPPEQPQPRPVPPPPAAAPTAPVSQAQPLPPPPAAKPAAAAVGLKPAQPAPAPTPKVAPPAAKAPAPAPKTPAAAPAAKAPAPAAAGGSFGVQIGAFASQAQADEGFAAAIATAPAAASGKSKRVEPVAKGGTTLYRTIVAGFGTRADAQAFCNQLKAAGKNCFVK